MVDQGANSKAKFIESRGCKYITVEGRCSLLILPSFMCMRVSLNGVTLLVVIILLPGTSNERATMVYKYNSLCR